jgi:hypothetical protein
MQPTLPGRMMDMWSARDHAFVPTARRRLMRVVHRRWLRGLVVLSLLALVLPLAGGAAAQTVGSSTIAGGAEWQYSVEASSATGGIMVHTSFAETYFMYLEEDLSGLPAPDNAALLEGVTLPRFREAFGVAEMPQLAQGSVLSVLWHLYEVPSSTGTHLALFAVDVTAVPGVGSVELLLSPEATFGDALASARANITINDSDILMTIVPSTAILNAAGLPANTAATQNPPVATTPAAVPTPTPATTAVPTPTPVAAQPGALTQTATAGQDTIAYGGGWEYSADNASPDVAFFARSGGDTIVYAYLNGPNNIGADPLTAVRGATDAFFSDFGAQNVTEVTAEILPSGRSWGLTTFDRNGVPGAFLIMADVTAPGVVRAQFLIGPRDQFAEIVTSAQQSFQINGVGAYDEIDVAAVTSLLGGTAQQVPAAPTAQPTTPAGGQVAPTQPAQATSGTANYQIEDSPAGCDRIGWVITDPAQRPVTQADLDIKGTCVGGATYVASCGTAASVGVRCTVNVAVTGAPMMVSYAHFTLVDAAGNRYPVDVESLMSMVMLLGVPELPEATVQPGATASGTIVFNVPADAPAPWVIEVAPETIATSGEQPGVLVIDGALQAFEVLGQ